jgi:hypothetical protein
MSYWPENGNAPQALRGTEGELVFVRVRVEPRLLEDLLDAIAAADFPINPEIRHGHPFTTVEFPAYETHVDEIRRLIRDAGIWNAELQSAGMLQAIA